jgi:hypothetical protein
MRAGRFAHLRIAAGFAEAEEIEAPDVKAGLAQRIAPGAAVEPVRDRQRRGKGAAMHVEHDARCGRVGRGQIAQEQAEAVERRGNAEMLFAGVELHARHIGRAARDVEPKRFGARQSDLQLRVRRTLDDALVAALALVPDQRRDDAADRDECCKNSEAAKRIERDVVEPFTEQDGDGERYSPARTLGHDKACEAAAARLLPGFLEFRVVHR